MNKLSRNSIINTENKLLIVRGKEGSQGTKRYKFPVIQ